MELSFLLPLAVIAVVVIAAISSRYRRLQTGEPDRYGSRFDTETGHRAEKDCDPGGVGWLAVLEPAPSQKVGQGQ